MRRPGPTAHLVLSMTTLLPLFALPAAAQTSGVPTSTGRFIEASSAPADAGSFPTNLAVSPDGRFIAVTSSGKHELLTLLSASTGAVVSREEAVGTKNALYYGLAWGRSPAAGGSRLYVSRGPEDRVAVYNVDDAGRLTPARSLQDPSGLPASAGRDRPNFVAGIALNAGGSRIYVAHNLSTERTERTGSLSALATDTGTRLGRVQLPGYPLAVAAVTSSAEAGNSIFVSCERDGVVAQVDVRDPSAMRVRRLIHTGSQPTALLLSSNQQRLFVANSGSDTVSFVNTATGRVTATVLLRPAALRGLPGATPVGMSLSPDGTRLYVALADMNSVAVVSVVGRPAVEGYIPVGWYPTSVASVGGKLFVSEAKGEAARVPNRVPAGPGGAWGTYILDVIEGKVAMLGAPSHSALGPLTVKALANAQAGGAKPGHSAGLPPNLPIKHVIYIVKENRTYDQVLGDLSQGNGDPSLTIFGREVTPNLHALAERFVLLDNFYCCAEVSADGWQWSFSGMASEYGQRNTVFNYSGRGRAYDFEGESSGAPVDLFHVPDVAEPPTGYLWDDCIRHGVTTRNYGCYVTFADFKGPDGHVQIPANQPDKRSLVGRTDTNFLRFDLEYADSTAWTDLHSPAPTQRKEYGDFHQPSRFSEWKREFDGFVRSGTLPAFMMVRFPRDHTEGTSPGMNSPRAMVADNDYAVGELVDAVSHSPYWKQTAIVVLEDDAQDGMDHIDAHRSPCYVISPFIRRSSVDHRFYNTCSALRTIEALLGIPPMGQLDAMAPVIGDFDTAADNSEPYTALLPSRSVVGEVNTARSYGAALSARLDFRQADRVPPGVMNDLLWHSVRGAVPFPRSAGQSAGRQAKRDDD